MNKRRVTAHRVTWTTEALNFFLEMHGDIDDMKISSANRVNGFPRGTLEDAQIIYQIIVDKIGVSSLRLAVTKEFRITFWYREPPADLVHTEVMSDKLETAYNNVTDLYVTHQNMWDDAEEVNNDSDFSDSDRSDMEEEVLIGEM